MYACTNCAVLCSLTGLVLDLGLTKQFCHSKDEYVHNGQAWCYRLIPLSSYNVLCCVFQMHIVTLGSCVVSVHCWNIWDNVYPWLLKHNLLASSRHNVIRGISTCWGDDWVMDSQSLDCLCINKQVLKRDTVPCYKAKLHEKHTAQDTSRAGYCQWTDVF